MWWNELSSKGIEETDASLKLIVSLETDAPFSSLATSIISLEKSMPTKDKLGSFSSSCCMSTPFPGPISKIVWFGDNSMWL